MPKLMKMGGVKGGKTQGNYGSTKSPKKSGLILSPAKPPKAR